MNVLILWFGIDTAVSVRGIFPPFFELFAVALTACYINVYKFKSIYDEQYVRHTLDILEL